jgi:transcriptional regulator of arginine metabolism
MHELNCMHKRERQSALVNLINEVPISNQTDLVGRLRDRGISVTQASISRDLDDLGIRKIGGRYTRVNGNSSGNIFGPVRLATAGNNLIVVKCSSGMASAITVRIDSESLDQVVGTLAGDDTIFIAVDNAEARDAALERIRTIFPAG